MKIAESQTLVAAAPQHLPRHRFTVEDYARMIDAGILTEDDRVELIEGEIIEMSPIGPRHVNSVTTLTELLIHAKPDDVIVFVQSPISLPDASQPQPDLALVRRGNYSRALPTVTEVFAVIEVADSTRDSDRETKFPFYAAAGIAEAWLVDLVDNRIERHTEPGPKGYGMIVIGREGATLDSTVVAGIRIPVDTVLGSTD